MKRVRDEGEVVLGFSVFLPLCPRLTPASVPLTWPICVCVYLCVYVCAGGNGIPVTATNGLLKDLANPQSLHSARHKGGTGIRAGP